MNKDEVKSAQEFIDTSITEENLTPAIPTFPEPDGNSTPVAPPEMDDHQFKAALRKYLAGKAGIDIDANPHAIVMTPLKMKEDGSGMIDRKATLQMAVYADYKY